MTTTINPDQAIRVVHDSASDLVVQKLLVHTGLLQQIWAGTGGEQFLTIPFAANGFTAGNHILVAAPGPTEQIVVTNATLSVLTASNVFFRSGMAGPAIGATLYLPARTTLIWPYKPLGWWTVAPGEPLVLNASATDTMSISGHYTIL